MSNSISIKDYKIVEEINTGGSGRQFYRCIKNKKTFILVKDREIKNYLRLQRHLERRDIGVPKIYKTDEKANVFIMEDLGKESLYELVMKKRRNLYNLYRMAIIELIKLQIDAYQRVPINIYYDYGHIKWEQDYFKEFFLHQFCGVPEKKLRVLDSDFKYLTEILTEELKSMNNFLMHRDYQSQNIFIKNGRIRIIDFQSARIGPPTYDLAALLKDSYVHISKKLERDLINYYFGCLRKRGIEFRKEKFLKMYRLSGLQRNMQALGAFANLSLNKNKTHFWQYIPRGLALLKSGLKNTEFQNLSRIVNEVAVEKVRM